MEIVWLLVSLVVLYFAAEWLVGGASSLAARMGISPLIIGLTIVSVGTSAPELLVSAKAALQGQSEISIGNVLGSNLFNIGIILGASALIYPLYVKRQLLKLDTPVLVGTALLFLVLFLDGKISFVESLIFIACFATYVIYLIVKSVKDEKENSEEEVIRVYKHWAYDIAFIVVGLVGLVLGSNLLVDNSIIIAKRLGMSDALIGLTIIAAGTSMPELATSVVAALKKKSDIAIGNVVGSNIFNITLIIGISAFIYPIETRDINLIDSLFVLGMSLLLYFFMKIGTRIRRWQGAVFVAFYLLYFFIKLYSA